MSADAPAPPAASPAVEPRRVGKYELLTSIGEGGMAEVFLARQRGPLDFEKVVVIKTIHPHLAKRDEFVRMFLDEARIAAQINHPNVVQVFDLGLEGSTFFIAMEYLAGEPLTALMQAGAKSGDLLPALLAAHIVAQAAEGLHAAHELKNMAGKPLEVVHRDVSPGNIVVLYDGGVKVVDFGVAKAKGRLTQTVGQQVKGKFAYMAPEQIAGKPIDRRADLFGLGVVLWEALTSRRLYRAENDAATLQAILGRRPKPPSTVRKDVPRELDAITMRALAIDPEQRYATARELQQELNALLPSTLKEQLAAWMHARFAARLRDRQELLERLAEGRAVEAELRTLTDRLRLEESASVALPDASFTPSDVRQAPLPGPSDLEPTRRRRGPLFAVAGVALTALLAFGALLVTGDRSEAPLPGPELSTVTPAPPEVTSPPDATPDAVEPEADDPAAVETAGSENEDKSKRRAPTVTGKRPKAGDTAAAKALTDEAVRLFVGGNLGEAEAKLKSALAADPSYAAAHRGLGLVYERAGNRSQAARHLRRYLKLAPKAPDAEAMRKRLAALGG